MALLVSKGGLNSKPGWVLSFPPSFVRRAYSFFQTRETGTPFRDIVKQAMRAKARSCRTAYEDGLTDFRAVLVGGTNFRAAVLVTSLSVGASAQSEPAPDAVDAPSEAPPNEAPPSEADDTRPKGRESSDSIPLRQPVQASSGNANEEPPSAGAGAPVSETQQSAPAGASTSDPQGKVGEEKAGDEGEQQAESPQFAYFGIGPTAIAIGSYDEYGVALAFGGRFPFHERMARNAVLTWGLTTFSRTEEMWGDARELGRWTTRAYGNVARWANEGENDDEAFRHFLAFYAFIGLVVPYVISGAMYVLAPAAATSYIDFQMAVSFHLLETRKGPYASAGLGTIAYVHPVHDEMKGGVGPSLGLGYDFGWFGLEARGFVSPRYLHGEIGTDRTDIFTSAFLFRLQGR